MSKKIRIEYLIGAATVYLLNLYGTYFFSFLLFRGAKRIFRHILPLYPYIRKKTRKCDRFLKILKKILKNFFRSKIMRLIMPYELSVKICSFRQRGSFYSRRFVCYEYDPSLNEVNQENCFFCVFYINWSCKVIKNKIFSKKIKKFSKICHTCVFFSVYIGRGAKYDEKSVLHPRAERGKNYVPHRPKRHTLSIFRSFNPIFDFKSPFSLKFQRFYTLF